MAEAVLGLVLGGIPLVLWALGKYHDPVKDCWHHGPTLSTLRDNIFVQQEQLNITLTNIGLYRPSPHELEQHLRSTYPHKHKEFMSIIGHMDGVIKKLLNNLDIDVNGKVRKAFSYF
jgi:hypothetical protein